MTQGLAFPKSALTVLLIEDTPDYAELVQQWLSLRTDVEFILNWTDSLQAGLNRLKSGGVDIVLLDLMLPDSQGLETLTRAKLHAPDVPILVLSADNGEQLALRMVQAGAQDYIVKSSCDGDSLSKAIQYAVARSESRVERAAASASEEQAIVFGVMGVKGGVGATSIACNLAIELQRQTAEKTMVADFDVAGGIAGFLLNAASEYSILDAASMADHLDASLFKGLVGVGSEGPDVLCSPSTPGFAVPDVNSLRKVLAITKTLYRWVVVDLGRPSEVSLGLLDNVTELFLVTSTSVVALYEARRIIDTLRTAGFEDTRLRLIVNQVSKAQAYSGRELDKLFGVPVYMTFSAVAQELEDACVQGKLSTGNSEFRKQMVTLARKAGGLQPEKPKSRVSRFFASYQKPNALDRPTAGVSK